MRLPDPPLLVITDRHQTSGGALEEVIAQACAAGCRWISLREKDLAVAEQIALARAVRPIAQRFGACLTVHGTAELAKAAGVDGVHLPAGSDGATARAILGPALVGVSVHTTEEATRLAPAEIDYALAGPAYETSSKPGYGPALGTSGIADLVRVCPVPVLAVGGVAAENLPALLRAGAAGIAVMGGVMRATRPARETMRLLAALAGAHASDEAT